MTPPAAAPALDFNQHSLVVVIPAFNEGRCIGSIVLRTLLHHLTVIVVDDGSCDDTASIAQAAGAIVLQLEHNSGKAAALNAGFHKARELDPDVIVTMDGDGQHLPEELPLVVDPILYGNADVVIGSRYLNHNSHVPRRRVLGHAFFNLLTSGASGVRVSDSQSGYRAFSRRAYTADIFRSSGFTVEAEMQFLAHEHGLIVTEAPITICYDDPPKRSAVLQGLSVLNGVLKLTGQYRPLLFFGLPGGALMLAGLALGLRVVERMEQTHELAVGTALVSVAVGVFGVVMLSTGFILHSVRGLLVEMLRKRE